MMVSRTEMESKLSIEGEILNKLTSYLEVLISNQEMEQ